MYECNREKFCCVIGESANEAESDMSMLQGELEETRETVDWLKKKVEQEWKRGCPQHGLTNGSLCYVLQRDKSNYSTAAFNCFNSVSNSLRIMPKK